VHAHPSRHALAPSRAAHDNTTRRLRFADEVSRGFENESVQPLAAMPISQGTRTIIALRTTRASAFC